MSAALGSSPRLTLLLAGAQRGDEQAVHELLVLVQPDIRRFAARSCYVSADIEDAVQESLWIIARKVNALHSITGFTGWLMTVVARECQRLARRVSAVILRGAQSIDDLGDDPRFATMPPDDLRLDLAAAISSLPPQYRCVVIARDLREMTINEIAAEFGLTREATKGRLRRGRLMLREYLSPEGG